MNTKQQGDYGVAVAISRYVRQGHVVCFPLSDNARYDLIVDKTGTLVRVQVKSTRALDKGTYKIQCATKGGNRTGETTKRLDANEFDELFCYSFDGAEYIFPAALVNGRTTISLGKQYDEYRVA